jgi:hypothetical protein
MTIFSDLQYSDVRKAIIHEFIGTAPDCFDANGNPLPRPGGSI